MLPVGMFVSGLSVFLFFDFVSLSLMLVGRLLVLEAFGVGWTIPYSVGTLAIARTRKIDLDSSKSNIQTNGWKRKEISKNIESHTVII